MKDRYKVVGLGNTFMKILAVEGILFTIALYYTGTPYFLMKLKTLLISFSLLYGAYFLFKLFLRRKIDLAPLILSIAGFFSLFPQDSAFLWTLGFFYVITLGLFVPFILSLYLFFKRFRGEKRRLYPIILVITTISLLVSISIVLSNLHPDPHFVKGSDTNEIIDCDLENNLCLVKLSIENTGYLPAENVLIKQGNETLHTIKFIGGKESTEVEVWAYCNCSANESMRYWDCRDCGGACFDIIFEGNKSDSTCVHPEYPCTDTVFIAAIVVGAWMKRRRGEKNT